MNYIEDKKNKREAFHDLVESIRRDARFHSFYNGFWLSFYPVGNNVELSAKGFKIHLSGIINNARYILQLFWDYIQNKKIIWKVVSDFRDLERQNLGYNGYSQIGKFITIYPKDEIELNQLLQDLEIIYKQYRSILIPSDYAYMNSQVVYYRYGDILDLENNDEQSIDRRDRSIPTNVKIPIEDFFIPHLNEIPPRYILNGIQHISGKSSVYVGMNLEEKTSVILKEAAPLHDMDVYGVDAINRLHQEKRALKKLQLAGFAPQFIEDFYLGDHYFVVMTKLDGESLFSLLYKKKTLVIEEILFIVRNLIDIIKKLNDYGIFYSDISLTNVLMNGNSIYLLDYEYCRFRNEINYPEILAGALGFYPIDYPHNDIKRVIYSIVSFMLNIEFFEEYYAILKNDSEGTMYRKRQERFYKRSSLAEIYDKAFAFKYSTFDELMSDIDDVAKLLKFI